MNPRAAALRGEPASRPTLQKWGGAAFFLLAAASLVAPFIYLVGNLRSPLGPIGYDLADFLFGPVWAASLVTGVLALRERLGQRAPRRMTLALLAAFAAAAAMVTVACIRASNRHYHLIHPELQLETSTPVLVVWTTLVAGVTAAGWHFLGWVLVLAGSAGWTSRRMPRPLALLYLAAGAAALFGYVSPESEGLIVLLLVMVSIWQGILLLRADPKIHHAR